MDHRDLLPGPEASFHRGEIVESARLRRQLTSVASWTFSTIGQAECARLLTMLRDIEATLRG
jgi:hypothetical protein